MSRPSSGGSGRGEGIYNVVVLGAGTAGLVTAAGSAGLGARVALVERGKMGGDCLNFGCVPSKALIQSSRLADRIRHADRVGLEPRDPQADYARVIRRMKSARARIEPHDSAERFESLGVDVFAGEARLESPHAVRVGDRVLRTRHVVIATGGRAAVPPIEGLPEARPFTNETFFENEALPRRLAILGGGPIGCEISQAMARLGSRVTLLDRGDRVLHREDADAAEALQESLRADRVDLRLGARVIRVEPGEAAHRVRLERGGREESLEADAILLAAGRRPNVENLGLEAAGVAFDQRGVRVDRWLRTTRPNIFAAGDVAGSHQFTHFAEYQARIVVRNILLPRLFGLLHARADDFVLPWCTFTEPEVARVGLNEQEARAQGIPHDVHRFDFKSLDRAILDAADTGWVKVLTVPGKDRILGATLVGEGSGEMIHELVVAMRHGIGLGALSGAIHVYPTLSQAIQRAGDAYQKTRLTAAARRAFSWLYARRRRSAGIP
ncbi:MAG TPA: mercuric reductase [Candidatus Polarisedimenticolia bacterium]|jgi:pyruvate/2-oxoglutarate dehydrogenase complex dihydrolipoamide dehydrogenase (E3) component|nr:mercuric reductase [Candidatus Polarisedimenticolia bacterium]